MSDSMCYEGEGRLLRSFEGFWVLMETPRKFMWAMTDEHLSDMASAVNEDADAITKTLDQVLSWAHDILIKVYFEKDLLVAVRLGEILLEAVVTKVEPYCSELRAAKGRILKVVQRLFDGNTPQLDSRYIIGIPWSRRDLKRHWASSVHKRVKVRKSVLPKEASALSGSNLTRISTSLLKGTSTIGPLNIGPVFLGENSPKSTEAISLGSSVSSFEDPSNSESEPLTPPILEVGNELNAPARRSGTSLQIDSCELTTWSERSTTSEDSDVVPSDAEDWSIVVGPQIISTAVRPRTKSSSGRKAPSGSRASSPGKNRVGGDLQSYDQEQTLPVLDLESCLHQ